MLYILAIMTIGYTITFAINQRVSLWQALSVNSLVGAMFSLFIWLFELAGCITIDWTGFSVHEIPQGSSLWTGLLCMWCYLTLKAMADKRKTLGIGMLLWMGFTHAFHALLWAGLFFVLELLNVVKVKW